MKHLLLTLITTFAFMAVLIVSAPQVAAFDKQVEEAVVAADWNKVVESISPTLGMGADFPSRLLMMHACRATNRNNSAERQLDIEPIDKDRLAWFNWADSMRAAHPENTPVLLLWADARFKLRRVKEYQDEGVSLPLASASRAIDLDADLAFAYKVRGDIYFGERRYDHALSDYKKAVELDPKLVEARFNLGTTYEQKGEFDQAVEEYTAALKLSPKFAKALTFRGAVYREQEKINEAIEDCNASIKSDPTYVMAHFVKAMTYFQADMKDLSIESFQAFIDAAPPKFARIARNAQARVKMLEKAQDY
ncbi:MAG: tetratricopeptide repeat protein [bacterium]|nr:tetratricopeptide repeat protein [bacterium]